MTTDRSVAMWKAMKAILDTIRDAGEIPAGTLYAGLMTQGCTLGQYEQIEAFVVQTGLVEKKGDCLRWVEPKRVGDERREA